MKDGKIEKNTECPFLGRCWIKEKGDCVHQGVLHERDFSCGFARVFELNGCSKSVAKRVMFLKGDSVL